MTSEGPGRYRHTPTTARPGEPLVPTLPRSLLASLLVLSLPLGAAACTEDDAAPAPLETPTSASTSAAPSPSDPTSSATARSESAEEFIRRWVSAQNAMQNTGDTDEYRSLGYRCRACEGFADRIDEIYDEGGTVDTRGWRILGMGPGPDPSSLELRVDIGATRYTEMEGGPIRRLEGGERTEIVTLIRRTGEWKTKSVAESDS